MPRATMFTVFAYDISADRARRRVAAVLEDHAVRVQDSVFEAWLTRAQTERLTRAVTLHLSSGDSLRVYVLGQAGLARSRAIGGPDMVDVPGYLIV